MTNPVNHVPLRRKNHQHLTLNFILPWRTEPLLEAILYSNISKDEEKIVNNLISTSHLEKFYHRSHKSTMDDGQEGKVLRVCVFLTDPTDLIDLTDLT